MKKEFSAVPLRVFRMLRCGSFDQADRKTSRITFTPVLRSKIFAIEVHPIASQEHKSPQMGPVLDNIVETFHHPSAETLPLVFGEDVNISQIGESDVVSHNPHESDLRGTTLTCICKPELDLG